MRRGQLHRCRYPACTRVTQHGYCPEHIVTTHPMLDDAHSFNWTRICDYTDCQAVAHILLPDDYGDRRSCTLPAHIQAMFDAHTLDPAHCADGGRNEE